MLQFERKTEAFIKKHSLIQAGDYLVAAVSGGPDSLAMVDFLIKRKEKYDIQIAVAHVDHMLRGEESKQDLLFVKDYCLKQSVPFKSAAIDISLMMEREQTGLQETARHYRYQFFEKVMKELQANKLVVAHHGDDQIETILMRLTRGASGPARAGIPIKRRFGEDWEIIRPLLAVSKQEIEEYCESSQLEPRLDPSNQKRNYTRNRFRLDVLPFLKQENAQVLEHFQRFHEEISEDEAYLQRQAQDHFQQICQVNENEGIRFSIPSFLMVPLPLQRRVIHLILNYLYHYHTLDIRGIHIDLIQRLVRAKNPSGRLDFPKGLKILRSYTLCHFTFMEKCQVAPYYYELYEGNEVILPNGGILGIKRIQDASKNTDQSVICMDPQDIEFPIIIRTRKPGDKISLKGMKGSKKIKDIFIDQKIPVHERAVWPIVADFTGKLLWIPGLKKSSYERTPQNRNDYIQIYYHTQTTPGGQDE
ncbi:tRNA lysidine(34) synthetase TilS [Lederbergia sp. NSJ-179]|uniref:tRNA lysidine(34) synthetase TilS n=1 Tax=Lederbergia sp. NSJ-179 TaxID=2931402 RepID=UPI001FD0C067|nr:tRNA lysidine(34) synthetase TilS [Lederbergia sp. NSJ-179]MCJ7843023.1 tRNA lysidine(34) synthetase TilS [Lederbergia sp. NSJ-179]